MNEETTITVNKSEMIEAYKPGDILVVTTPDRRWWKRLWHYILRKGPPVTTREYGITNVTNTTFTVDNRYKEF